MRRLVLIVLAIGLGLPAGASRRARASGRRHPRRRQRTRPRRRACARGGIIGRFDSGRLIAYDPVEGDGSGPIVYGDDQIRELGPHTTLYIGEDVRFRLIGGSYRVTDPGLGADISAVGKGSVTLDGSGFSEQPGRFQINGSGWQPMPDDATRYTHRHRARARAGRRARQGLRREAGPVHSARAVILSSRVSAAGTQTVLVVEDESSIASFVALYLKNAGYGVKTAATGGEALSDVAAETPALIVLDLMLPDIDGIEVCRRIRKSSDVPILMLTARDEDVDKIIGLEVGADDYLTKPFNPRELVARVKSILRRSAPERRQIESKQLRHGDLLIDAGRREVHVGDEEIQLAPKEFDLLWELLDHRGLVLTRDQLLERVWGYTFAGDTRTVDVHVRQLRRKLGDASPIVTVWGVGYKVAPAKEAAA